MALGRRFALLAALVATLALLAGCGGGDSSSAGIEPSIGDAINAKLDQVQERVAEGDCTGENSASSALESLQGDVNGPLLQGADDQFVSDLSEMLDQLSNQIDDQCKQKEPTTTSSTTSSTSSTTTTVPPTTTEPSTTTKDHETSSTTTPEDTTTTPPDNQGNNQGNGPPAPPAGGGTTPPGHGGTPPGQSGGFTPGKKPPKEDKPPKTKPDKPKPHEDKK
jgi:hypothetical protein